jgi:protein-S-isoprenylcysteine O-methyltransferase
MSDRAPSNGHAAPLSSAAIAEASTHADAEERKPLNPQYPLTSWADTRQNVACIAFLLGCTFTLAVSNGIKLFSEGETILSVQDLSTRERLWNTLTGPRFGIYIALLVVFHMSEFLTTAIYNPGKASVRCEFIIQV